MAMRQVVGCGLLLLALAPRDADANRPDGLDCDKHSQIPVDRCQEWKTTNAQGRWWCHWDLASGRMTAVYGSRSQPVTPGLDITNITRESARSNTATRHLLETYVRQHVSRNESLFGFKPQGYEIQLTDFQRRPAGIHRIVQADGSIREEVIPAVTTIHVQQILKSKGPIDGATIQIQVDDDDRLVSMFSSFLTDLPASVSSHTLTAEDAVTTALAASAPGRTPAGEDEFASAIPTFDRIGADLRPLYRVSVSLDAPGLDVDVIVDGITGAILETTDQQDDDHDGPVVEIAGFTDLPARVFPDHPPIERPLPAASPTPYPGASATTFVAGLEDVSLRFVRTPIRDPLSGVEPPFTLEGYFARIENEEQEAWRSDTGPLIPPLEAWTMLVDFVPLNDTGGGCRGDVAFMDPVTGEDVLESEPDGVEATNRRFESRFDEVSAYFHITNAAEHFFSRHHHQLGRSNYANPSIKTVVNSLYKNETNAHFRQRCEETWSPTHGTVARCKPVIVFDRSPCWRLLGQGDDVEFGLLPPSQTVDFYSWTDLSRDKGVAWHEYTHAINWDVSPIKTSSPGEDFENAGGAFKEAVADFFPNSLFDRSQLSEWSIGRDINPFLGGVESDATYPYDLCCIDPNTGEFEGSKHANSLIWSGFLWDLRERSILMQQQLQTLQDGRRSVEDVQFEALTRMPNHMGGFRTALQRLMDADAAVTGKQLSYDIIASAARHGIKLADRISGVAPQRFVAVATTALSFTVYSGANDSFVFEAATDPSLLGAGTIGDPRYYTERCGFGLTCSMDRIQGADDDRNLQRVIQLDPTVLSGFLGDQDRVTVFYRVTTYNFVAPGQIENEISSDISGAGISFRDPNLPIVIVTRPGASGPVCPFGFFLIGGVIATGAVAKRRKTS